MLSIMGFVSKIFLQNTHFHVTDIHFPIVASSSVTNRS